MTNRSVSLSALVALAAAASSLACSGSVGGTGDAQGIVVSVSPASARVQPSGTVPFTASVSGTADLTVRWSVMELQGGTIDSTTGNYVAPSTTGLYHVVATSNADPTVQGTASVTVTATPPGSAVNEMGINIDGSDSYMGDRIFADIMKVSQPVSANAASATGWGSGVDALGWPTTTSFQINAWVDTYDVNGTWGLEFRGRAASVSSDLGGGPVTNLTYDQTTNTSKATIPITATGWTSHFLTFTGAYRDAARTQPGLTGIKLLYPTAPGSTTPHPSNAVVHQATKAILQKFAAVRYMDLTTTNNGNRQTDWADRTLPGEATIAREKTLHGSAFWVGASWEDVIRIANDIGRDAYINVPAHATDDYILKTAQVFKYGSDGVNPYTTPQANPVYRPLDPGLKLYIEYSNEIWNFAGYYIDQHNYVASQATADGVLNFDGDTSSLDYRWVARRTVQISNIFRGVFGDADMITRIRPVLMAQMGNGDIAYQHMKFLQGYYNNLSGNFVAQPHPPSYYVYGGGGSGYYSPANESAALPGFWSDGDMSVTNWRANNVMEVHAIAAAGYRKVAYEGGPGFDSATTQEQQAFNSTGMRDSFVAHQNEWSSWGGDLLCYYRLAGGIEWGFLAVDASHSRGNVFASPQSQKLQAVDALNASAPTDINFGQAIPGTLQGNGWGSASFNGNAGPNNGSTDLSANQWASYTFFSNGPTAPRTIQVTTSGTGTAAVYLDGVLLGSKAASGGLSFANQQIGRGLHGVIVRSAPTPVSGTVTVSGVTVQ
jgi:hypothetical protein